MKTIKVRKLDVNGEWTTIWINGKREQSNDSLSINYSRIFKKLDGMEGKIDFEEAEYFGDVNASDVFDYRATELTEEDWSFWKHPEH